ncbi:DUF4166 domain-containing protein [Halobacteriales archaeon QS_1_68_17]|nr:MAG: DUF4166 domain-containing protein [Halobacteriales archaeon QS_1_68_17]
MTGVYERALGGAADRLHPEVRARYDVDGDDEAVCVGRGRMHISRGTHVVPALWAMTAQDLLFPEAGTDVPFVVYTACFRDDGREVLSTVREFEFGRTRRFVSRTVWDPGDGRLLDFLGTGGHLVTELHADVEAGALVVTAGRQWVRIGGRYRRVPGPLAVDVEVRDRYDPAAERFAVSATVENPLAGHVLSYRGTFDQEFRDASDVPADGRHTRPVGRLPPARPTGGGRP